MTSTVEAVWLFDLDGTVLTVNSFPLWARDMLLGRLPQAGPGRRLSVSARCALALARRKLLYGSHTQLRRSLQQLWSEAGGPLEQRSNALVERLARHVRPSLYKLLADVAVGRADAILTTAAAAEYAEPLARQLGFSHVIATPAGGHADSQDNSGEIKRERTLAYLEALGWSARPRILFADTAADLPLARSCQALVWLGRSAPPCARIDVHNVLLAKRVHDTEAHDWVLRQSSGVPSCT